MKKLFLTLLFIIILTTGCSINKVENNSVQEILESILYKNNKLENTYMDGYKLYLPRGTNIINKNDYNLVIKDSVNTYYLYIDTIAYYYQTDNAFEINKEHFYSQKFINNDISGYIDIEELENEYFVVIMYNYAKIEAYVTKRNFNDSLTNMSYILSTIKFNDNVIKLHTDRDKGITKSEKFDIYSSKKEVDNWLIYDEQYGTYKEKEKKEDNELIDIED
ncbi:MAG: hypothetical protein MJ245_05115 [Clostridia bacterium]|nr:hypothetical protein [Clostridia bacterium]